MKRKHRTGALLLAALGLFLIGTGLWQIRDAGNLLEYVLIAPQAPAEIAELVQKKEDALEGMAEALEASCVTATATGAYVSAPDMGTSAQATLFAGGDGFFQVYPRYLVSGRLPSETELKKGEPTAALDEDLAFALFPTVDPVGQTISVNGTQLRVVGVVRHERHVGEADLYTVYAPLLSVQEQPFSILTLSAKPLHGSGASVMFADTASDNWAPGGEMYNTDKETMRAKLPLRYALVLFAASLLLRAFGLVRSLGRRAAEDIHLRLQTKYLKVLLGRIAAWAAALAASCAVLLGALYAVAGVAVAPLYVFPEWVPDNIVEWSSIRDVFWNLATEGVQMISAATGAVRAIQFWAGVIQWGTIFGLIAALLLVRRTNPEK